VCEAFLDGLHEVLGDGLVSLYLYGAVAFPRPEGWALDVDFHVLVAGPPTDAQREGLARVHGRLAERPPYGKDLDGYYVLLADAGRRAPPTGAAGVFPSTAGGVVAAPVDEAWSLHCAAVLAGRSVLLAGRDPRTVVVPPTWPDLHAALSSELDFVVGHPEHAAFGVLNACRIAYSASTGDVVVSKAAAADWGMAHEPAWQPALEAGIRAYTGRPAPGDDARLAAGRDAVVSAAGQALRSARGTGGPGGCRPPPPPPRRRPA
jgi:hypothetical protein